MTTLIVVEPDIIDLVAEQWRRERPGMPVDSIGIVGRVLRVAKVLMDERRRLLSAMEVDSATFDLLATLRRAGDPYRMTPTELARASLLSGGAVTQRVSRAEAAGLVRTLRTPSNRRTIAVELTSSGHQFIEHNIETLIGRERELLQGLDPAGRNQLSDLLRRLLATLPNGDNTRPT